MAKVKLKADLNFFNDLANEYDRIIQEFPVFVEKSVESQLEVAEKAIQRNWVSMIPHGRTGDMVYDSIGMNVSRGKNGVDVVGSVGVFKIDSVFGEHMKASGSYTDITTKKEKGADINAPQLAWWTEFGTYGNAGIPFLSNAFYSTINEQEEAFKETFESLVQRTMK